MDRYFDLKGKIALVTGASRGIGAGIARELAKAGARVVVNYNTSRERVFKLAEDIEKEGGEVLVIKADVAAFEEVEFMFSQIEKIWGEVDIIINNAGVSLRKLVTDTGEEEWDKVINTNLKGVFLCCRRALPAMIRRRYGRIINIASIWGITGASMEAAYAASKGGVIAFTKSLAREAGYSGVTVNAIAPGVIETDMLEGELTGEEIEDLQKEIPAGRLGKPEDIASLCLYLASDRASYINGQVITVDGGFLKA
ncbi:3-oxoacyl-[acyl-carrier protein] reductase [Thermosyntropha lipolytica DSM 11003]|uniref:3-oxoacyl-[acyl-carrier protein] reductase n=1 Tax=Thermosyntropha lipolytica DSM 11003 TaxID=1123382 RepID=A0A1M5S3Y4_9FIRM|nr:SDR family oxidoreductase [Thermosyntropha lipolytica]SHH33150.1 3-oxoacyl-[acyl-carrier protein] reductase [Thermosyntropha lipolytica DSM 11003]